MTCLVREDGSISRNQKEILELQVKFYRNLYSANTSVEFKFVEHNGNKLSEEEKQNMDRKVTFEEVTVALKNLKVNKTPGCNGLMPSTYQILWDHIGRIVFDAIVYAQEIGELHLSAKEG